MKKSPSKEHSQEVSIPIGIAPGGSCSRPRIVPFFIPYAGCPHRCVFCAQDKQTGLGGSANMSFVGRLQNLMDSLKEKREQDTAFSPVELAFYGGTFTALPQPLQTACLHTAAQARADGLLCRLRCSTRPDATSQKQLSFVRERGMDLVELGVQTFSTQALLASRRGYTGETALQGCRAVLESGLSLGVQLLPGMPGSTPESFALDVSQTLELAPACTRFYPCLVVDGTPLADAWRAGHYTPWDTDTTVKTLGHALAKAWLAHVPVIRLSLAPEASLEDAVLAGPRHPALGSMIQGKALLLLASESISRQGTAPDCVELPVQCQGYFFGHQGALRAEWNALGVTPDKVCWTRTGTQARFIWKNRNLLAQPLP